LYETDFQSAINNFNTEKRKHALVLLNRIPVFKDWNMIRKTAFGDSMTSSRYETGEVVYSTGEEVISVYFVREGLI
jgi:hypothetical protein